MADLGAWKSLQEAVIAGSAQADRLAARVMRAESTDAGRAELLGKLIQASGAADWQELAAKMGASEDRLCVCVCVCVCFLLGSLFLTFCNVLKKLQTRWASQYLKKHCPPPEPLGESVLQKNHASRAVGQVSTKNNRTSRAVGQVST